MMIDPALHRFMLHGCAVDTLYYKSISKQKMSNPFMGLYVKRTVSVSHVELSFRCQPLHVVLIEYNSAEKGLATSSIRCK